ncbi:stress responsive A/B barrel domain-containing protein [Suillus spraguei]|nr:stress responsive A/B barrel domain-containing protein [Suillus spraguei]
MTIHHIVLYTFKSEATPEQRQSMRDCRSALPSQIPAIQSIITGETVSNPFTHGFEEGVIFVFESVAKLNEYRPHKAHMDFQTLAKPLVENILIFDIETAP